MSNIDISFISGFDELNMIENIIIADRNTGIDILSTYNYLLVIV